MPLPLLRPKQSQSQGLEANKAAVKSVQSHKERSTCHLPPSNPRYCCTEGIPNCLRGALPGEMSLTALTKCPLTTRSATETPNNTPVFTADIRAEDCQPRQAVRKLWDTEVAKLSSLIRPDGEKEYVPLALDYDVLYVASKTGFKAESN